MRTANPVNTQRCENVLVRWQRVTTKKQRCSDVIPKCQNYNVALTLFQRWIVSLIQGVLLMLY